MKLTRIQFHNYRLPLTNPILVRGREGEAREGVLIEAVFDDAATGYGDVAPLPGFSREDLYTAMEDAPRAARRWQDEDWPEQLEGQGLHDDLFESVAPSLRCGMEQAWLTALAARVGKPLCEVLGGAPVESIAVNGLLGGDREDVLRGAEALRQEGYRSVKLKVGRRTVDEDAALVREVKQALGADIGLRLDANRAWTKDQAVAFSRAIVGVDIEYIEEPLARSPQLAALQAEAHLPLALDETVEDTPASVWAEIPGIRAIVLKPTVLGGMLRSLRLGRRALGLGAKAVVSAAFESGAGILSLVHLAAALGGSDTPAGLDTYRWIHEDVLQPRLPLPAPRVPLADLSFAAHTLNPAVLIGP